MNRVIFMNLYLCVIFCLVKTVISDDILHMATVADYHFRQSQHLQNSIFDSNVDTRFLYTRIKRHNRSHDAICMQPKEVGPCRGYFPRWYYDVGRNMCLQFTYGGCRGNRNNFERYADCNSMCETMLRDSPCDCGTEAMRCVRIAEDKICKCPNNKTVINGLCSDCTCHNGICNAETGTCKCLKGYGLQNNTCVECDCGEEKQFCHFVEGLQFCSCGNKYVSVNQKCEDCVCGEDEICIKRPITLCICPKGSGLWSDVCDDRCDCTTNKICMYLTPQIICKCMPGKAKLDGVCVDCDCGDNAECEFKNGTKTCTCKDGYQLHDETCEECDCGTGHSCTFKNGSSVCLCADDYVEHNGTCKECSCGPDEQCEIIDGEINCICKENFIRINSSCTECFCGEGHACNFVDGKKLCLCKEGFADNNGKCERCDCGPNHSSCEFQNGKKECECRDGFEDNEGICEECFCGEKSTCFFKKGEKFCVCPHAQVQRNGTCGTVCLDDTCRRGTCEVDGDGFYCNCEDGYYGHRCDKEAILSQGAIYLISILSAVTLFWIILLLICILKRRVNRYRYYRQEKLDARMNILADAHPDSSM